MFATRLKSGIVLMALTIALLVYGSYPLFVAISLISVIGLFELYRTVKMEKSIPAFICYLASIFMDILTTNNNYLYILLLLCAVLIILMICYVIAYPKFNSEQITMLLFGLIYVTLFLSCVFQVRFMAGGILTVWLIYISAWGSDTCAYCTGKLIGKHKLPSELSPKKTIEGCVGGVVGAALIGAVFALCCYKDHSYIWQYALICGVGAIIGQFGDLAASAIKRNHDIKDYGKLIPGHGGILDRFDSIIFTAPVVFILALILR